MTPQLLSVTAVTPAAAGCPGFRARDAAAALPWVPDAIRAIEGELRQPVGVLVIPAGFFAVDSFSSSALQELSRAVFDAGVTPAVATLVDADHYGTSRKHLKQSYGVVMLRGAILGQPVQQTSWTGAEGRAVRPEDVQGETRIHEVGGISVGLLCCGEIFSPAVKATLISRRPAAVINLAHRSVESNEGVKSTWCKHLQGISSRIGGWALFAGASTDPEGAEYNYHRGERAEAVYRCCVTGAGIVLRCFLFGRAP